MDIIFSSPNKNGKTMKFLKKKLDVSDADFVFVYEKKINPCVGCDFCKVSKRCKFVDDMAEIYKIFEESECIVFASPIYNFSFPSPMKAIIDRSQPFFHNKIPKNPARKAVLVTSSGENDKTGAQIVELQTRALCLEIGVNFEKSFHIFGTDFT
jgi:multimeric flavodoxin WrbA